MDVHVEVLVFVTFQLAVPDSKHLGVVLPVVKEIYDELLLLHHGSEYLIHVVVNKLLSNTLYEGWILLHDLNPHSKSQRVGLQKARGLVSEQVSASEADLVTTDHRRFSEPKLVIFPPVNLKAHVKSTLLNKSALVALLELFN